MWLPLEAKGGRPLSEIFLSDQSFHILPPFSGLKAQVSFSFCIPEGGLLLLLVVVFGFVLGRLLCFLFVCFKTRFLCLALAVWELTL